MNRSIAALALAGALGACTSGGESTETSTTTTVDPATGAVTTTTTRTTTTASASSDNPLLSEGSVGVGDCDQPLVAETEECTSTTTTTTSVSAGDPDVYGRTASADLTVNDMTFDPATGELVLNNVPFDGDDNLYARNAAVSASIQGASGTTFSAYNNVAGFSRYYAVFRRSPNEFSQVGALGTDRYISYGFGGAAAQRLNGDGSLPDANESYLFTGEYAAVRTFEDSATGAKVQYVSGTSQIQVDIEDFDNIGAVEGLIVNRRFFDENGVEVAAMAGGVGDFITLRTAEINFDDWTISSSSASLVMNNATSLPDPGGALGTPSDASTEGTWEGLFAGPNGEEVAGIVFVEGTGPVGIDTSTGTPIILTEDTIRETGVFQATR